MTKLILISYLFIILYTKWKTIFTIHCRTTGNAPPAKKNTVNEAGDFTELDESEKPEVKFTLKHSRKERMEDKLI